MAVTTSLYALSILSLASLLLSLGLFIKARRDCRRSLEVLERLLDGILSGNLEVGSLQYEEGLLGSLASRALRIEELTALREESHREEQRQLTGLLGDISHQVKTPLANIALYHDLLSRELETFAAAPQATVLQEHLQAATQQTEKLRWLLEQLVKTARLESKVIRISPTRASLRATVARAIESVLQRAQLKGMEIEVEGPSESEVEHDRKWSAEAIANLLDNAIKYSPEGSTITLRVRKLELYTTIMITDEGPGITPESLQRLFERFYRDPRVSEEPGVGLGLYLAQYIMNQQDGYITAENRNDAPHGARFSLYFKNPPALS